MIYWWFDDNLIDGCLRLGFVNQYLVLSSARARNLEHTLLAPSEINSLVPWLRTDDLEGGIYLPQDGVTDPTNTAMSLARGAKNRGI